MLRSSTPNKKNRYSLGQALALSTIILVPSMLFSTMEMHRMTEGEEMKKRKMLTWKILIIETIMVIIMVLV